MTLSIKLHNIYKLFYCSKNEVLFWVGGVMHSMPLSINKPVNEQLKIRIATFAKSLQNTLQETQTLV